MAYIEDNLAQDVNLEKVARYVSISPFYLQKGFAILCGYSMSEYIRNRKLSVAGQDLINTDEKIIDIAIKYGYESADSFTKAFTRFHGSNPSAVRKGGKTIKEFSPLKVNLILKGGCTMQYKIEEKKAFEVVGLTKIIKYDEASVEVPKLWQGASAACAQNGICTRYGISIDEARDGKEFEYLIGDDYAPGQKLPTGFAVKEIPAHTWAIFTCNGRADKSMATMNQKIFQEWLPNSADYEIAAGYNVEMYADPKDFAQGVLDKNYYCELWIPVQKK
ncbi:MAG: AraC family transcriptional regulator [bacterium]|nr:AraC family transcriptional regulator [bacterium]